MKRLKRMACFFFAVALAAMPLSAWADGMSGELKKDSENQVEVIATGLTTEHSLRAVVDVHTDGGSTVGGTSFNLSTAAQGNMTHAVSEYNASTGKLIVTLSNGSNVLNGLNSSTYSLGTLNVPGTDTVNVTLSLVNTVDGNLLGASVTPTADSSRVVLNPRAGGNDSSSSSSSSSSSGSSGGDSSSSGTSGGDNSSSSSSGTSGGNDSSSGSSSGGNSSSSGSNSSSSGNNSSSGGNGSSNSSSSGSNNSAPLDISKNTVTVPGNSLDADGAYPIKLGSNLTQIPFISNGSLLNPNDFDIVWIDSNGKVVDPKNITSEGVYTVRITGKGGNITGTTELKVRVTSDASAPAADDLNSAAQNRYNYYTVVPSLVGDANQSGNNGTTGSDPKLSQTGDSMTMVVGVCLAVAAVAAAVLAFVMFRRNKHRKS